MLVVSVLLVLLVVGAVLVWQAGWVAAGARARSVADLVALAAARAQQSGIPACQVAEVVAAENAALLAGCTVTTGWGEFVVDITIEMVLVPQVVGGPRTVSAESRAGVIHDQA